MVRGPQHLHELLSAMASSGIGDAFVVGGDASEPAGPYASAIELVREMRGHDLAPLTIGMTAYPEGHPSIPDEVLEQDLLRKGDLADYMVTQMCFDAGVIVGWLERTRAAGVQLPAYLGVPGLVDSRRLLEISARVGVGTSISYIRKQHGMLSMLYRRRNASARLMSVLVPQVGGDLGVAGVHFFTFNRLIETARFADPWDRVQAAGQRPMADSPSAAI
jgi:methylenetetrahydrofolate reductase (NADPH)